MVADSKEDEFPVGGIGLEKKPSIQSTTALEHARAKLPYAHPGMSVNAAPILPRSQKGFLYFSAFDGGNAPQLADQGFSQSDRPAGLRDFRRTLQVFPAACLFGFLHEP